MRGGQKALSLSFPYISFFPVVAFLSVIYMHGVLETQSKFHFLLIHKSSNRMKCSLNCIDSIHDWRNETELHLFLFGIFVCVIAFTDLETQFDFHLLIHFLPKSYWNLHENSVIVICQVQFWNPRKKVYDYDQLTTQLIGLTELLKCSSVLNVNTEVDQSEFLDPEITAYVWKYLICPLFHN